MICHFMWTVDKCIQFLFGIYYEILLNNLSWNSKVVQRLITTAVGDCSSFLPLSSDDSTEIQPVTPEKYTVGVISSIWAGRNPKSSNLIG